MRYPRILVGPERDAEFEHSGVCAYNVPALVHYHFILKPKFNVSAL